MIIGFDIDDTITDTFGVMFGYGQKFTIEELGRSGELLKTSGFTNHSYCQEMHNWTVDESEKFFRIYYKDIIEKTQPFMFAIETIKKLKEKGNKIILITARWDFDGIDVRELTEKWLEEQKIPYDKLIVNAITKKQAAIENKLDIFVDDSFKNCQDVASTGIKTYIMDTRYNKGLEDERIERIYSWPHLEQVLRKEIK